MTSATTSTNGSPSSNLAPHPSIGVEGYHTFLPSQPYTIGSLLPSDKFPQNANPPALFESLSIRGVEFGNRIWVSPMCQYYGKATDHHFVHLGSMAMRGWGNIMVEATAVVPEGRISPEDSGIWSDDHIPGFKRIVDFVHATKGKIGIQLAHAGRKASTMSPWVERMAKEKGWTGGETVADEYGGWPNGVIAPSDISFKPGYYPDPKEASLEYIESLKKAFLDAVKRCKIIGFDYIEIHGAHGYLFHEFVSPISNHRTDQYGGSLENRLRLPLETTKLIREAWDGPLFYRISSSDQIEEVVGGPEKAYSGKDEEYAYWGIEQTTILVQKLADLGVDLVDVSSGGNDLRQKFKLGPGYQVPYAAHIKKNVKNILVGSVGMIIDPKQANQIIEKGEADVVFMAREVLRDIDFPLRAAQELGPAVHPAVQYERHMVVKREANHAPKKHAGQSEVEGEEGTDKKRVNGAK